MKFSRVLFSLLVFIIYKKSKGHRVGDIFRLCCLMVLVNLLEKYYNCSKTRLYHQKSELIKKIINKCPTIKK